MTVRDRDHNGVTITSVDVGDLSALLGGLGVPGDVGDVRPEIAFAARDDFVVIGVGGGIVERILDVEAGASLATSATYGHVIEIAGARNNAQVYVALDACLALAERFLPDDQLGTWNRELKPYLDHLAALAMTATMSNGAGHAKVVLTVK
jgi:ethanolamine utilization microcompartment shell protein EutL